MKRIVLGAFLLSGLNAFASIDGTVVNGTTGKPQAGVNVLLIKPGQQGMQTIGSVVSDAEGHFLFQNDRPGGGPQLLQAVYGGVNYNKLMTPNIPTTNVEVDVYEATKAADGARVEQHMMLIEPTSNGIAVSENVIIKNDSKTTYSNPAVGGLRFFLPAQAHGQVRVQVEGSGGMPIPRTAEKTETNGIYKVDYPIKPGDTTFEVDYSLPPGTEFQGQLVGIQGMTAATPLRLIVPAGVSLAGTGLESAGTEPKTQATIYNVTPRAGGLFSATISGTGALRTPEATQQDEDSPPVTEGAPRIYTYMGWLLGISLAILAVGLVYLYQNSPTRAAQSK